MLDEHAAGDELQVGLRRGDQELELSVELGGPGELRRARTRFSEHPPADERLGELMRRREDFDHKWQAELDERLQELREHFDRGWGELSEELGEALQERPEAAMRLREARAELNRWRDERHALLEGLRSSLRGFHWQDRQRGDDDERAPAGPRAWFGPGADGGSWSFQVPRPDADGEPQVWFFGPDGQRGKLPWKEFFAPDGSLRLEGRWEEHEEHGESEEHEDHEDHGPGGFFRWFAPDDGDEPMPRRGRMRLHSPSQPGQPGLPEPPHSPHADDQHGPDARGMADSLGELRRELRDLREELRELRRRLNER